MIRNNLNLNIQSEEIALLQTRLRLTAEKLKQVNDNRLIKFANNAELSSNSSNAKPNVSQDISNNQTIRTNKARPNKANRARAKRANRADTFSTVENKLNFLAHKYVTTNKR